MQTVLIFVVCFYKIAENALPYTAQINGKFDNLGEFLQFTLKHKEILHSQIVNIEEKLKKFCNSSTNQYLPNENKCNFFTQ